MRLFAIVFSLGVAFAARADEASLGRASARLVKLGTAKKTSVRAARHIELGLPSAASRDNDDDRLLVRNGYIISYNGERNAMNWASWVVEAGDLGPADRNEHFRPDATLPARFYKPNSGDYKLPGYSRGHMVRSGERTANDRENAKTYVFTNMLPQAVNNNSGPWNAFEDFYRDEVKSGGLVAHVIAGGMFGTPPVQARKVAVPTSTWKIVALLEKGQRLEGIGASTRVVSVVIPNNNDDVKVEHDWARYRVSVADIEKKTGLAFFDALAPEVAQRLKSRVDDGVIPPPPARRFTPHDYGDDGSSKLAKIVATQITGTVKFYDSDKKYGFVTLPDGNDVYVSAANRLTSLRAGETVTLDVGLDTHDRTFAMKVRSHSPDATLENVK